MKHRYGLLKRPWGVFYAKDRVSGNSQSLKTRDRQAAQRLVQALNETDRQPMLNLQLARTYLSATDPAAVGRTWRFVMDEIVKTHTGPTRHRWETAIKDKAFDHIRDRPLVETRAEHVLRVLHDGTVSTNEFLRRLHCFALDMNWLLGPVIPKRTWPKPEFKKKRAITADEHRRIIARERNPERLAFYEMCWHLGGSQTDIARLQADNVDWKQRIIGYSRVKTGEPAKVRFGAEVEKLLRTLPASGPLFPYLARVREADRATEFRQRCQGLGISGVTLHSYRYAWAERAKECGYPERFAQEALGHSSKAVHRAYASNADVTIPAMEDYQQNHPKSPCPTAEPSAQAPPSPTSEPSDRPDNIIRLTQAVHQPGPSRPPTRRTEREFPEREPVRLGVPRAVS